MEQNTKRIFLDDVRAVADVYPDDDPDTWVVCRGFHEAVDAVTLGWPVHVSFDHDLGDGVPSGMDFAKFLVELDLLTGQMPENFTFEVHSANPPGAANIRGLMQNYLDQRGQ